MDTDEWLWVGVALIACCIGAIALLSASDAALASVRRNRIAHLVESGNPRAVAVERLLEQPERFLGAARLSITLLTGLVLGLSIAIGLLAALRVADSESARQALVRGLPLALAVGLLAPALLCVLGLALPRTLASARSERLALAWAGWWGVFTTVTTPLVWLAQRLGTAFSRVLGAPRTATPRLASSEQEIKNIVEGSAEQGVLEDEEKEMIHSIFDFADTVVRKVMVPRIDITCLEAGTRIDEALPVILKEGHSRIPIYEDTVDKIVGVVHAKDLLHPLMAGQGSRPLRSMARPPYFVPEGKKVGELLGEFKRSKNQLAIVVDEYGGTSGLVTVEDLLEEIVGDIQDEYDIEEPEVVVLDPQTCIMDARLALDEAAERLGLELPTEEYDTVGGFVFGLLGRLPAQGDCVAHGPLHFIVERTDGHRIQKVRVVRVDPAAEAAGSGTALEAGPRPGQQS